MTSPPAPTTAPDVDYLRYTDRVDQFASAADFAAGTLKGVAINGDHVELALPASDTSYPRMGTWTSQELSTPFAFTELLATFNATFPARTGVVLETRVRSGRRGRLGYISNLGVKPSRRRPGSTSLSRVRSRSTFSN